MITLAYVALVIAVLAGMFACWLDWKSARLHRGSIPASRIAIVCMDCNRHISGPIPSRAVFISHGLCKPCADRWKEEVMTEDYMAGHDGRPARR